MKPKHLKPPTIFHLTNQLNAVRYKFRAGSIVSVGDTTVAVSGISDAVGLGDRVEIHSQTGVTMQGEVLGIEPETVEVLTMEPPTGLFLADTVCVLGPPMVAPDPIWVGRVLDPDMKPLDGLPLFPGFDPVSPFAKPPPPGLRRGFGARVDTGNAVFNTLLPLVRGQRIGLFAGSGVGKSTLLGQLARSIEADVIVIALIGERGRELRHFVEKVLGDDGMKRAIVVAATSDQSPLQRRNCAHTAMSVAEYFRDRGQHVLFIADSITRFAEAHRDVAFAAGERAGPGGFPSSMPHQIMGLAERAGPGVPGTGDITAIFSVLVAGSDMEGPVADTLRGVLDGHVVLDRKIAERGRYPAIDLLQSVSRSLPDAATEEENAMIADARRLLGAYDKAELMIQSGLYVRGADLVTDRAIQCWPALDRFLGNSAHLSVDGSFKLLADALELPTAALANP